MTRLSQAKNRKDKRRLLAEYNHQQELVWGQAKSINALALQNEESSINIKRNAPSQVDVANKVYNPATHSYIDRDLYAEIMKKDKRSANERPDGDLDKKNQKKLTQILSKNQKLHSVNVYEKTQRFEFKVNLENEKQR